MGITTSTEKFKAGIATELAAARDASMDQMINNQKRLQLRMRETQMAVSIAFMRDNFKVYSFPFSFSLPLFPPLFFLFLFPSLLFPLPSPPPPPQWFCAFYGTIAPLCVLGAVKNKSPQSAIPVVPLTFALAFQYDAAYGGKQLRGFFFFFSSFFFLFCFFLFSFSTNRYRYITSNVILFPSKINFLFYSGIFISSY